MDIRRFFPGKDPARGNLHQTESSKNAQQHDSLTSVTETEETVSSSFGKEQPSSSKAVQSAIIPSDLGKRENGPVQPKLAHFPYERYGLSKRAFQYSWFEKHNWLEYSVQENSAFCFPCRHFGHHQQRSNKDALISSGGFKNWKRALDSFKEHETSSAHISSTQGWLAFKDFQKHGNIMDQLYHATEGQIRERREYMARLVSIIGFFARNAIPIRGHDETESSLNRGNFMECLSLLKKIDPFLQQYTPPCQCYIYISIFPE